MKKILINRKIIEGPWGGGNNFVKSIYEKLSFSGYELVHTLVDNIDLIIMIDPRYDESGISINEIFRYKKKFPNVKILHRINECDARKNTEHMDQLLLQCSTINTKTIFVSNWIKNYFNNKGWACKNQSVLYNGVDEDFFKVNYQEKNDEVLKVVTHHWSNNYLKGFDVYEFLDYLSTKNDKISFTYIGRDRGTFSNSKTIPPLHGKALADELCKYDVYISASRHDPGPNHVLESVAVGLPTYVHAEGGGAIEFVDKQHAYKNFFEIEQILLKRNFLKNSKAPLRWKESMDSFWKIILS